MKHAQVKKHPKSLSSVADHFRGRFVVGYLAILSFALLAGIAPAADYTWNSSVAEGDFNSPSSWSQNENYPTSGDLSFFYNMTGSWTVNIPSSMSDDGSYTLVRNLKNGSRLVFDANGTTWRKVRTPDSDGFDWNDNKILKVESGGNMPLLEISANNDANDRYGFDFENGRLVYNVADTGNTLSFERGIFNLYEIDGAKPSHKSTMFYDNTTQFNKIVMKPGTTSYWGKVEFVCRSGSGSNAWRVEGGEHHVYNGLNIKVGYSQASTGIVEVVSGSLALEDGAGLFMSNLGYLRASGDGTLSAENATTFLAYNGNDSKGWLEVDGHGSFKGRNVTGNRAGSSEVFIDIDENGSFRLGDTLSLGSGNNSVAHLTAGGDSSVYVHFSVKLGEGSGSVVDISLSSNATMTVNREDLWRGGAGSRIALTMRDHAKYIRTGIYHPWEVGNSAQETAIVDLDMGGGTFSSVKEVNLRVAPGSSVRFAGTDCTMPALTASCVTASAPYRPDVSISAGTVTVSGAASFDALDATGGRLVTGTLTGGTGADILFNGMVVAPYAANSVLVGGIATAKVGATGLVIDPAGKTTYLDQEFADADSGVGRICINGDGVVKTRRTNEHATTELVRGTLGFDGLSGLVAFGKSLAFSGGTLDLTGTTGLVCDTLAVGEARGFVSFPISSNGEYPVITVSEGVDLSVVSKLKVANRMAGHSYSWKVADTESGTVCSIVCGDPLEINVQEGTETFSNLMDWGDSVSVNVAAGAAAVVSGQIEGDGTVVSKTGGGSFTVSGDNAISGVQWIAGGGLVSVTTGASLGEAVGVRLVDGTFEYAGTTPVRVEGPLEIAAASHKHPVVLKATGDIAFTSASATYGELVKTGSGTLTFDVGEGVWDLGVSVGNSDKLTGNGAIALPASGASPEGVDQGNLRGVSILDGTLEVKGLGADKSIIRTQNDGVLGANYASSVPATLRVIDARFNFGSGSHSPSFCNGLPSGAPAPVIALTNAYLYSDSCRIGSSSTDVSYPQLFMKDSTFFDHYNVTVGGNRTRPVIVADNSKLYSDAQVQWYVDGLSSATFSGKEAMFGSTRIDNENNYSGQILFRNSADLKGARVKFEDGARLVVSRGLFCLNDNGGTVMEPFVFDGGIFEVLEHSSGKEYYSLMAQTWTQGFQADAKGLTIRIDGSAVHDVSFPIRGTGKFTKDGTGTLKLIQSLYCNGGNNMNAKVESTELLVQNTGGLHVAEGKLILNGALVAGKPDVEISAGATLDLNGTSLAPTMLYGGGTVTNGTISATTLAYDAVALPTFSDVAFSGTLIVDFGKTADDPLDKTAAKTGIVVAHYTGDAPANLRVKAVNTGIPRVKADVSCVDGDIVVTAVQSGFSVIIR